MAVLRRTINSCLRKAEANPEVSEWGVEVGAEKCSSYPEWAVPDIDSRKYSRFDVKICAF